MEKFRSIFHCLSRISLNLRTLADIRFEQMDMMIILRRNSEIPAAADPSLFTNIPARLKEYFIRNKEKQRNFRGPSSSEEMSVLRLKIEILDHKEKDIERKTKKIHIMHGALKLLKSIFLNIKDIKFYLSHLINPGTDGASAKDEPPKWLVYGKVGWIQENLFQPKDYELHSEENVGSLIVSLNIPSFESLEELWKMYKKGELQEIFDTLLLPSLMEHFDLETLQTNISIYEDEYKQLATQLQESAPDPNSTYPANRSAAEEKENRSVLPLKDKQDQAQVIGPDQEKTNYIHQQSVKEDHLKQMKLKDEDAHKLRRCYALLEQHLKPHPLTSQLYSWEAISKGDLDKIHEERATWRQNQILCDIVSRKSQFTFMKFVEGLKRFDQDTLANALSEGKPDIELEDKLKPLPLEYQQQLMTKCTAAAMKANQKLLSLYGIRRSTGIFYCKLSLAPKALTNKINREDYVQRTAAMLNTWDKISVDKVFDQLPEVEGPFISPRNVLICGVVGIGKTVLTHKMASAVGHQSRFKAIYRFECRSFRSFLLGNKEYSFADLIFGIHGPSVHNEEEKSDILECLNSSEVLIIFDGLDELEGFHMFDRRNYTDVCDPFMGTIIPNLICNIVEGNLVPNAHILCTTRPNSNVDFSDYHRIIITLGFSPDSINECMKEICEGEEDTHERIMKHLDETQLYTHCYVPLTCVILGMILKKSLESDKGSPVNMDSFTQLYIEFTYQMLRAKKEQAVGKLSRKINFTPEQLSSLSRLSKMAAHGMMASERIIIFKEEMLERFLDIEADTQCGMLDIMIGENNKSTVASFVHLSYQEFITSTHMSVTWNKEDIKKIFQRVTEDATFDIVIQYMAGLLGERNKGQKFLMSIDKNMDEATLKTRYNELITELGKIREETSEKRFLLLLLVCISEANQTLPKEIQMDKLDLSCFPQGLLPNQLVSVGYYLEFNSLTTLSLANAGIGFHGVKVLVSGLEKARNLTSINMSENQPTNEGLELLADSLKHHEKLEEMRFGWTGMMDASLARFGEVLENNKSLKKIEFGERITNNGLKNLAERLKNHENLDLICVVGPELSPEYSGIKDAYPVDKFKLLMYPNPPTALDRESVSDSDNTDSELDSDDLYSEPDHSD